MRIHRWTASGDHANTRTLEHSEHEKARGGRPLLGFPVTDLEHAEVAELWRERVARAIDHLQVGQLVGAKSPGISGPERDSVALGSDGALTSGLDHTFDLKVGEIKKVLQLTPRKWPVCRLLLILRGVRGAVDLRNDLSNGSAE